ncbi:hypothetical protein [Paracoccus sp. (in: a-proteobacteria)]|uniref:hypothetical protein n=1 Tax=Paracoccus sp. TaxID=267 RepID=UPI00321FAECD
MKLRGHGMNFGPIRAMLALAALAGCGDMTGDYPALMPTDRLLAAPELPAHAADAATDPGPATAALDVRGRALAGQGGAAPAGSDLQSRARALRERAQALAAEPLAPPDCPADDPGCASDPGT